MMEWWWNNDENIANNINNKIDYNVNKNINYNINDINDHIENNHNNTPTPYFSDGTGIPFDINATDLIASVGSADQNGRAAANYAFDTASCEPHTFHFSILTTDAGATMYNINALVNIDATACEDEIIEDDNNLGDNDSDSDGGEDATTPDAQGCGCSTATGTAPYSSGLISLFFIVGLTTFSRLRRRRTLP